MLFRSPIVFGSLGIKCDANRNNKIFFSLKSSRKHSFISIKLHVNAVFGAQQILFNFTKLKESIHEFPTKK